LLIIATIELVLSLTLEHFASLLEFDFESLVCYAEEGNDLLGTQETVLSHLVTESLQVLNENHGLLSRLLPTVAWAHKG